MKCCITDYSYFIRFQNTDQMCLSRPQWHEGEVEHAVESAFRRALPLMPILMLPFEEARAAIVLRPATLVLLLTAVSGVMATYLSILGPGRLLVLIAPGAEASDLSSVELRAFSAIRDKALSAHLLRGKSSSPSKTSFPWSSRYVLEQESCNKDEDAASYAGNGRLIWIARKHARSASDQPIFSLCQAHLPEPCLRALAALATNTLSFHSSAEGLPGGYGEHTHAPCSRSIVIWVRAP